MGNIGQIEPLGGCEEGMNCEALNEKLLLPLNQVTRTINLAQTEIISNRDEVITAKDEVLELSRSLKPATVEVTTLEAGEQATVDYDDETGVTSYGIPKGDRGEIKNYDSLENLLLEISDDTLVSTKSFRLGSGTGGNTYRVDRMLPQSRHNGVTIIALAKRIEGWSEGEQMQYFEAPETGELGCLVAENMNKASLLQAGAVGDKVALDTLSFKALVSAVGVAIVDKGKEFLTKDVTLPKNGELRGAGTIVPHPNCAIAAVALSGNNRVETNFQGFGRSTLVIGETAIYFNPEYKKTDVNNISNSTFRELRGCAVHIEKTRWRGIIGGNLVIEDCIYGVKLGLNAEYNSFVGGHIDNCIVGISWEGGEQLDDWYTHDRKYSSCRYSEWFEFCTQFNICMCDKSQ